MSPAKPRTRAKTVNSRDVGELRIAMKAVGATEHNPIQWAAILRLVAPIVARLAARQAATYVAGRLGKRLGKKIPQEAAEFTATKIADIVSKITLK